ncbi:hypothetical protein [Neobacillus drentensis]|uniref:hypothetical protein n=1 Tax=Neobacillus drentensis TaxID=220684 RepID=UPI0030019730
MHGTVSNIILILLLLAITLLVIKLQANKKKLSSRNPSSYNSNIKIYNKYEIKQKQEVLDQLPIIVDKVKIQKQELEKNKKLSLPNTAIPLISEVLTAFYPVIQDSEKLKVIFSPEMMGQIKDGTAKFMEAKDGTGFRAMAIATEGKPIIKEHAKLIQDIDPTILLNASFQIASVIVAQQHMQQINQSLKQIKQQLDDIKKFHMNEFLFHAKGNIDYFEVRVIPHFQASGSFDIAIRNQAEYRFNKTMDMLPNIMALQQDLMLKVDNIRDSVYFGKMIGEENEVTKLREILNDYSEHQRIINLYFKWINEMYIPFLRASGYSISEITAVENKVKSLEDANISCYEEIFNRVIRWTDSFKVKFFRINEEKYIEKATSTVRSALPTQIPQFRAAPILNGIDQPLEMIVEYIDNNQFNTYLVES